MSVHHLPDVASDDDLMRRVQADDSEAFAQLHDRYARRVFGFARVLCSSTERAQEAAQDAFLTLWTTRRSYEGHGALPTWLFALTRNRSVDIQRHHRRGDGLRASDHELEALPAAGCVEDEAIERDERTRRRTALHGVLAGLPAEQRAALELAFVAELSHVEIAEQLALPLGTVKGRIRLGLSKTRAQLAASVPSVKTGGP